MKAFVSWSGGKDSALAYYWALMNGFDIKFLASMMNADESGRKLLPHRLSSEVIDAQCKAIIGSASSFQQVVRVEKNGDYEFAFLNMLKRMKAEGVTYGIFGDNGIGEKNAQLHRQWIEDMCLPLGITPILPTWDIERAKLIDDFISIGFEATIICACDKNLGPSWLGRNLNSDMLLELKRRASADKNGEVGYYHTFVVDGPIFKCRFNIEKAEKVHLNDDWGNNWYLDIQECSLSNSKLPSIPESYSTDRILEK